MKNFLYWLVGANAEIKRQQKNIEILGEKLVMAVNAKDEAIKTGLDLSIKLQKLEHEFRVQAVGYENLQNERDELDDVNDDLLAANLSLGDRCRTLEGQLKLCGTTQGKPSKRPAPKKEVVAKPKKNSKK